MRENAALTRNLTETLVDELTKTQSIKTWIARRTGRSLQRFTALAAELDCVVEKDRRAGSRRMHKGPCAHAPDDHPIGTPALARP